MPWERIELKKEEIENATRVFEGKVRFLIDENLPSEVFDYLKEEGWNVKNVKDVGLVGKDDATVLSFAWRDRRMIITSDSKFPDGQGFREQSNPGIIILPNAPFDSEKFLRPFFSALLIVGSMAGAYEKSVLKFNQDETIEVTNRNLDTGKIETVKYRFECDGVVSRWV